MSSFETPADREQFRADVEQRLRELDAAAEGDPVFRPESDTYSYAAVLERAALGPATAPIGERTD